MADLIRHTLDSKIRFDGVFAYWVGSLATALGLTNAPDARTHTLDVAGYLLMLYAPIAPLWQRVNQPNATACERAEAASIGNRAQTRFRKEVRIDDSITTTYPGIAICRCCGSSGRVGRLGQHGETAQEKRHVDVPTVSPAER
jgi:hypothetical protein